MDGAIRDTRPLARWVIRATWITVALGMFDAIATLAVRQNAGDMITAGSPFVDLSGAVLVVVGFVTAVLAFRWIYLVAQAAYILSGGETIRPGWAVGWYFVPIANLWKPYEAMKQAWQVSENPANWPQIPADYLPAWWGLYLLYSVLSNAGARLASPSYGAADVAAWIDFVSAVVALPLAWLFTRLVRELSDAQSGRRYAEIFA